MTDHYENMLQRLLPAALEDDQTTRLGVDHALNGDFGTISLTVTPGGVSYTVGSVAFYDSGTAGQWGTFTGLSNNVLFVGSM
jgi:hypothetical protein